MLPGRNRYDSVRRPDRTAVIGLFVTLLFLLSATDLFAQGRAGSTLLGIASTEEASTAGTLNLFSGLSGTTAANPALSPRLSSTTVGFSSSIRQYPFGDGAVAIAAPIGRGAGVVGSARFVGISEIDFRSDDGQKTGTGSSGSIILSAGGGLSLGPATIGGGLRYLRRTTSGGNGLDEALGVDISATIEFLDRLRVGTVLNNIAGGLESGSSASSIPSDVRLHATWQEALTDKRDSSRVDPTGLLTEIERQPETWVTVAAEARIAQFDNAVILGVSIEAVPVSIGRGAHIGLRFGANSRGEIAGGTFFGVPGLGRESAVAVGGRYSPELVGTSLHVGIDVRP